MRYGVCVVMLALSFFCFAFAAAADDPKSQADQLNRQAAGLLKKGQYSEAVKAFEQAYALDPQPKFLFNMALSLETMGQDEKALRTYRQYLETAPDAADASTVKSYIAALRKKLLANKAEVVVKTDPPDATVYVDGVLGGKAPATFWLEMGSHVVRVRNEGYKSIDKMVSVERGRTLEVDLRMEKKPIAGLVEISCNVDGANVFVDDLLVGSTPLQPVELQAGQRTLKVEKAGHEAWTGTALIQPGGRAVLSVHLSVSAPTPALSSDDSTGQTLASDAVAESRAPWWHWGLVGGGVAVVGGGAMLLWLAAVKEDGIDRGQDQAKIDREHDAALTMQWGGIAAVGVGAAAVGTGVYYLVSEATAPVVSAAPMPGGGVVFGTLAF